MSKNIEDYLEPVDPTPFPTLTTYIGDNTLSSTETIQEIVVDIKP